MKKVLVDGSVGSGGAGARPARAAYPAPIPQRGRMRTRGEASINAGRVTMSVRLRFNPLRGLTPDRLAQYLDQFDLGFFRLAAIAWDKIERRDYTLKAVAPKRKKAVARHGWEVLTLPDPPPALAPMAEHQAAALRFFYDRLTATNAVRPDECGGLALLARQMMDAHSKYYAVHEIVWQPGPAGLTAMFVHCPLWWFEGITGKLRYLDSEFNVYGRDMAASEWLVTTGEGLMEACAVCFMFKNLALGDWLNLCEKWGQPFIDAATSASPDSDEWETLRNYVEKLAADGAGVRSQNSELQLIERKHAAESLHEKMVQNMDRAMTILWRGGDLGTHAQKDATGASLQAGEGGILEADDAALLEETLAAQVSRHVIAWKFGPNAPVLAYLRFNRTETDETDRNLKVDQFLLDAGAPLEVRATLERYGREVPAAGANLLQEIKPDAGLPAPPDPTAEAGGNANP